MTHKRRIYAIDIAGMWRGKKGAKHYKAKLACGHNCTIDVHDRDRGWTYCMDCYFHDVVNTPRPSTTE